MGFDLRSDTFTKPSAEMLSAMVASKVGDDVYGEDPTVLELERKIADMCGKPAALFCCSSTMSNQLAIRAHLSQPPSSLICHQNAHVFQYEAGGAAFHSQAHSIAIAPHASYNLTRKDIEPRLVLDSYLGHCPVTQLICLENTLAGVVMPLEDIKDIYALSQQHQIKVHMDGSRLWNASMASGISLAEYSESVDSLNLCLSKGMGCPVGAMLVGSQAFIDRARILRKLFGGGWRQAGVLAAAGRALCHRPYMADHA